LLGVLHRFGHPCPSQLLRQNILFSEPFTNVYEIVLCPEEDQECKKNTYGKVGQALRVF